MAFIRAGTSTAIINLHPLHNVLVLFLTKKQAPIIPLLPRSYSVALILVPAFDFLQGDAVILAITVGVVKDVGGVGVLKELVGDGVASDKCWRHSKGDFPVSWAVGEAASLEKYRCIFLEAISSLSAGDIFMCDAIRISQLVQIYNVPRVGSLFPCET